MEDIGKEEEKERTILLTKLNSLEKKVKDFLNFKLKVNITGNELSLDLNNKNIGNSELMLLTGVISDKVEDLNLNHNNISDVRPLKELNKLKKLDLSFNKLNGYSIYSINDIRKDVAKETLSYKTISINLDNNNLVQKDINELKNIITCKHESLNSNNNDDKQAALLNKLNRLENKILLYFNNKLSIKLTGKEVKINLSNKNIGNIELDLLSGVDFKDLEEIILSHNNISNIEPLQNFKHLKKIDLSYNKINNINSLKSLSKINTKIEKLYLNNNAIKDVEIIKENIFPNIIEINLDNNNVIKKDIDEIRAMIINNKKINLDNNNVIKKDIDEIRAIKKNKKQKETKSNKSENTVIIIKYKAKKNTKIRLFGESFLEKKYK